MDTLPESELDNITRLACDICDAPIGMISLVDETRQWYKSRFGIEVSEAPRSVSFCSYAIEHPDEMFIVPDAASDSRFRANPLVTGEPQIRFYAGAPLVTADKYAIGTLCVIDRKPREINDVQKRALHSLACQIIGHFELRLRLTEKRALIERYKRSEEALRMANERLLLATAAGEIGIWELEISSNTLTWDARMMELYGFTQEEFPGGYEAWTSRLHPEDRQRCESEHIMALCAEKKFDTEFRIVLPNGRIRDIKANAVVTYDETSQLCRMIGLNQDITDSKRAAEAQRESELRFRTAINAMHEGLVMHNEMGEIVMCNRRAEQILGLTVQQMTGLTSFDPRWGAIHEDGSPYPAETHPSVVALRDGVEQHGVVMGVRKSDGEIAWVSVNAVPLINHNEVKPYAVLVTFADITKRRLLEQQIYDQMDQINIQMLATVKTNVQLEAQRAELAAANIRLESLARTDGLTGLLNHRSFHEQVESQVERSRRYGNPLSLILLDIDSFKAYNDTFGHPAGDSILRSVAEILQNTTRSVDLIARYGGEEFAVILPETSETNATAAAERFRLAIESFDWQQRKITASFGVTTMCSPSFNANFLIASADRALYHSKETGRNRVTHSANLPDV